MSIWGDFKEMALDVPDAIRHTRELTYLKLRGVKRSEIVWVWYWDDVLNRPQRHPDGFYTARPWLNDVYVRDFNDPMVPADATNPDDEGDDNEKE